MQLLRAYDYHENTRSARYLGVLHLCTEITAKSYIVYIKVFAQNTWRSLNVGFLRPRRKCSQRQTHWKNRHSLLTAKHFSTWYCSCLSCLVFKSNVDIIGYLIASHFHWGCHEIRLVKQKAYVNKIQMQYSETSTLTLNLIRARKYKKKNIRLHWLWSWQRLWPEPNKRHK